MKDSEVLHSLLEFAFENCEIHEGELIVKNTAPQE